MQRFMEQAVHRFLTGLEIIAISQAQPAICRKEVNMKANKNNVFKYLLCILCIAIFSLAGYFFISSPMEQTSGDTWANSGYLKVGKNLTIKNADNTLTLLESKDVLSANGLYYATWIMGESTPYVNSEGITVDLYDVQLYLILSEHKNAAEAGNDMTKWMDLGRNNYEVLTEEEIICNGQPYALITYNCVSEDNPYARGISSFGVCNNDAICIELTCRENFEEDLKSILTVFLDNCSYEEPH